MAGGTANSVARRAGGRPPSVRHVRTVGLADRASVASSGERHGAAGESPRYLPWGDTELPGVRLGAHDVGGRGGHGERCPSCPAWPREAAQRACCGAVLSQLGGAVAVRHWECKRLSECPASSLSAS